MIPSAPPDPLVALWRTASRPDTSQLFRDLQRDNQLHRQLNRSVWSIVVGIGFLLIFEESTGRLDSHGIISAIWILGLLGGAIYHRKSRRDRWFALTSDTVSALRFMLARAKRDLLLARCLYAGVPFGALVGAAVSKLARIGPAPWSEATHPYLHVLQTAAGLCALVIMIISGVVLARSRHLQVRELSQKLTSISTEL